MRSLAVHVVRSALLSIAVAGWLAAIAATAEGAWRQPVGGASPINVSSGVNASPNSLAAIGGIPYLAWNESDGTNQEIRVARLGASGSAWEKVADSASPINESPTRDAGSPSLADVAGVPYVAWHESDGTFTSRLHVARLNVAGTAWEQPVGGPTGIGNSASPGANAGDASLAAVGGVPYVAWSEFDFDDPTPANRNLEIRVARLDETGPIWEQPVGGDSPINESDSQRASEPSLAVIGGVPYVAWTESDGVNDEVRVARLNEAVPAWEKVGQTDDPASPINESDSRSAQEPSLTGIGGVPYVAWYESDGTNTEVRVARLNDDGTGWEQVVGGASPVNEAPDRNGRNATLTAFGDVPYVAWTEFDGVNGEVRVARLNEAGTDWDQVVGGASPINEAPDRDAELARLGAIGSFPYVVWTEQDEVNFEARVARLEPDFLSRSASATDTGATLSAEVRTFGLPYPVGFEYGASLESETSALPASTGQGNEVTVSRQVGGLAPGTPYAYRPFATAGVAEPRVFGALGTFATTPPPSPPAATAPPPAAQLPTGTTSANPRCATLRKKLKKTKAKAAKRKIRRKLRKLGC